MKKCLQLLGRDTHGGTSVEYAFILAVVFLAIISAVDNFAGENTKMWNDIATKTEKAHSGGN